MMTCSPLCPADRHGPAHQSARDPGRGSSWLARPVRPGARTRGRVGPGGARRGRLPPQSYPYFVWVTLNGQPLSRTFPTHAEILAGGELRFQMQADPMTDLVAPEARPFSMTAPAGPGARH